MADTTIGIKITADASGATKGATDAATSLNNLQKAFEVARNSATELNQALEVGQKAYASIQSVLGSAKDILDAADAYAALAKRVETVTGGAEKGAQVMDELNRIAMETHAPINELGQLFVRMAQGVDKTKISFDDLTTVTEAIGNALVVNKTTANEAEGALLQFSQALGSGVLRGEEFNSVNEQMPVILDAVAKYLDVPRGKLKELASEGKLTSDIVIEAVKGMSDELKSLAAAMPKTASQGITDLNNAFSEYVGESEKVRAASELLGNTFTFLAKNLETLETALTVGALLALPKAFGVAETAVKSFTGYINSSRQSLILANEQKVIAAQKALILAKAQEAEAAAALKSAQGSQALSKSLGTYARTQREVDAAQRAYNSAIVASGEAATKTSTAISKLDKTTVAANAAMSGLIAYEIGKWAKENFEYVERGGARLAQLATYTGVATKGLYDLATGSASLKEVRARLAEVTKQYSDYDTALSEARDSAAKEKQVINEQVAAYTNVAAQLTSAKEKIDEWSKLNLEAARNSQEAAEQSAELAKILGDEKAASELLITAKQKGIEVLKEEKSYIQAKLDIVNKQIESLDKEIARNDAQKIKIAEKNEQLLKEKTALEGLISQQDLRIAATENDIKAQTLSIEKSKDLSSQLSDLTDKHKKAKDEVEKLEAAQKAGADASAKLSDAQKELEYTQEVYSKGLASLNDGNQESIWLLNQLGKEYSNAKEKVDALTKIQQDGADASEKIADAKKQEREILALLLDALKDEQEARNRNIDAAKQEADVIKEEYEARIKLAEAMGQTGEADRLAREEKANLIEIQRRVTEETQKEAEAARAYAESLAASNTTTQEAVIEAFAFADAKDREVRSSEAAIKSLEAESLALEKNKSAANSSAKEKQKVTEANKDLSDSSDKVSDSQDKVEKSTSSLNKAITTTIRFAADAASQYGLTSEQLEKLGEVQQEVMRTTTQFMQGTGDLVQKFGGIMTPYGNWYNQWNKLVSEVAEAMARQKAEIEGVTEALSEQGNTAEEIQQANLLLGQAAEVSAGHYETLKKAIEQAKIEMEDMARTARETAEDLQAELATMQGNLLLAEQIEGQRKLNELQELYNQAMAEGNYEAARYYSDAIRYQQQINALREQEAELTQETNGYRDEGFQEGQAGYNAIINQTQTAIEAQKELNEEIRKTTAVARGLSDGFNEVGNNIAAAKKSMDDFSRSVSNFKPLLGTKGSVDSFIREIADAKRRLG